MSVVEKFNTMQGHYEMSPPLKQDLNTFTQRLDSIDQVQPAFTKLDTPDVK